MTDRKLLLATTNPGKTQEIRILLQDLPVQIHSFIDTPPKSVFSENGKTFMENARGKCLAYSRNWDDLTLAEDSGLEITSLEEAPGVFSARFAGPESTDEDNIDKVLSLMRDIPIADRDSRFVSCLVLARKETVIKEISSEVQGFITNEKAGRFGFGYDPVFYFPPLGKTFAQLTPEEKNHVSHRGKALRLMRDFLQDFIKQKVYE